MHVVQSLGLSMVQVVPHGMGCNGWGELSGVWVRSQWFVLRTLCVLHMP